jgi:uncharacterized protein YcnI
VFFKQVGALALATAAMTGAAAGHVRVFPDANNTTASACSYAKFVVRVPVEKDVATNRVDLDIPRGVIVYGVQPKSGWQFSLQKTRGVISGISWTGGRLMPGEFDEFAFLAATPKTPGQIAWNALQYYEDGSVVKWTGPPNADTPHSITTVAPAKCLIREKVR